MYFTKEKADKSSVVLLSSSFFFTPTKEEEEAAMAYCCPEHPRPHALLCPFSAQGHVNPFLSLANLLASKGIAVTFVSPRHRISRLSRDPNVLLHPLIRLVGLPERIPPTELDVDEGFDSLAWQADVIDSMKDDFEKLILNSLHHEYQDTAAQELALQRDENYYIGAPDCIISDPFVPWMKIICNNLSIPMYVMFTSPAWALTTVIHIPLLSRQGLLRLPLRSTAPPQLMKLPGLPTLRDTDIYHNILDVVPDELIRAVSNCSQLLSQSSRVLLNTTYEIEQKYIDALQKEDPYNTNLKIVAIGPLANYSQDLLDDDLHPLQLNSRLINCKQQESLEVGLDCLEWLNTQPPASVVYVSFGSMYIPSDNEVTELAHGLEGSGKGFLWILRPPPSQKSPQKLSSWVSSVLPDGFQSRTQERGFMFHHWAPQLRILANPAIGSFWTHCGWNSVMESMWCGVPMIAYPQFAEQRLNCRMIVDELNVAVELEKDEGRGFPDREAVERAVRRVSEGEESVRIRKKVAEAREKMIRATKEKGSSYRNVETIVEEIFGYFHEKMKK